MTTSPSLMKDHFVAGDLDFAEEVGVEEDGRAAVALRANNIADQPPPHGIEPGSRLIEKNQFRLMNQRLR